MKHQIIAIVGMCGVGKSVASDLLEEKGYKKIYFGGVTMEKLKEQGLEITPENEKKMREGLRQEYGMAAYAILLLPKIQEYAKAGNVVLDGLYSWEELVVLREELKKNLTVIAIVADKKIRYQRLASRPVRPFTEEEAKNRDLSEILNLSKAGPIAYADYYLENNGTLEEYKVRFEEILENIRGE